VHQRSSGPQDGAPDTGAKPAGHIEGAATRAVTRLRWPRLLVLVICAAGVAAPFLATRFPPLTDLPQHVAQVRLFWEALAEPEGPYRIQWFTPYGTAYLVLAVAWSLGSPASAGRLAAIALALLWIGAVHFLAAARGRAPEAAALASVAVFNHTLYWGFLGFAAGWPVFALWFLLTTGPRARRIGWLDGLGLLACAGLLYLSHALWLAVGALWFAVSAIASGVPWRTVAPRLLAFSPVLLAAAIWYPRLTATGFDSPARWFTTPSARVSFAWLVDAALGGLRGPVEYVVVAAAVVWIGVGAYQHRHTLARDADRDLCLAAFLLLGLALLLPDKHTNTILFASRWVPPALALLVLGAPTPRWRPAARGAYALSTLGLLAIATAVSWIQVERLEFSGLAASLDALPPRPRVLGLDFVQDSQIVKGRPFIQTFAYAQVMRGGELNFSFADFAPSPVVFKDRHRPTWTGGLEWHPHLVRASDLAQFDRALINADAATHQEFARRFGITPVTGEGRWRLYRVQAP
jgi:hypothetical protein